MTLRGYIFLRIIVFWCKQFKIYQKFALPKLNEYYIASMHLCMNCTYVIMGSVLGVQIM